MAYRLGIDLGTASIGAVAVLLDVEGQPSEVAWHEVRIFSEPVVNSKQGLVPKKADRRQARQLRRQVERRARRLRRVAYLADLLGLDRRAVAADDGQTLTELRAKAASEPVALDDLLRVLMRLSKRRGYAGGFTRQEDGTVKAGSDALTAQMAELAATQGKPSVTLGEYLRYRQQQGLPVYLKADRPGVEHLFALRKMVQAEFDQIWQVQAAAYPELNADYFGRPIKQWFFDAIFFQRPLKSPAPMVGNCLLEADMPRAPRAQMAAQQFRIEKTLHDLRWGGGRRAERLTPEQIDVLHSLFEQQAEISISTLIRYLGQQGLGDPRERTLNIDRGHDQRLKGNTTLATWRKLGLLEDWLTLSSGHQVTVINLLADLGGPELLEPVDWHRKIRKAGAKPKDKSPYRTFPPEVIAFIDKLRSSGHYDRFSNMGFESGRSSYSLKALNRLNDWLRDPWWRDAEVDVTRRGEVDEDAAIRQCYPQHFAVRTELADRLGEAARSGNDVVDGALRELRRVVNRCIGVMGGERPQEIIVEMSREVGRGVAARNELEKRMRDNEKVNQDIRKKLEEDGIPATSTAILRYRLWQEQDKYFCPYCTTHPISLQDAMDGSLSHVEHILPRSLTQIGRKRSELVLAHAACNSQKDNQTPWQAFGHDAERWAAVERAAARFEALGAQHYGKNRPLALAYYRKASLLRLQDFEAEVLTDESIAGFADRQLHQSSWIAKLAAQWLQEITPLVSVSRGEFTALLRRQWRLDTVIPQLRYAEGFAVLDEDGRPITKEVFDQYQHQWEGQRPAPEKAPVEFRPDKRIDHRHHGLDALVIALTNRSLYMNLARRYREEHERRLRGEKRRRDWSIAPPMPHLRDQAVAMLGACKLSHKPDRNPAGRIFQDTAYGVHYPETGGRALLTQRKPLSALVSEKSVAGTLKNIGTIASAEVCDLVRAEFERRIAAGQTPAQALSIPVLYQHYGTTMWRVRCVSGYADGAIKVVHQSRQGSHEKRLLNDGYACLEVRGIGSAKPEARLVSMYEAMKPSFKRTMMGCVRLFKGDVVADNRDGKRYRIGYFTKEGNLFLIPHLDPRNFDSIKEKGSGKRKMAFSQAFHLVQVE